MFYVGTENFYIFEQKMTNGAAQFEVTFLFLIFVYLFFLIFILLNRPEPKLMNLFNLLYWFFFGLCFFFYILVHTLIWV